MEMKHKRRIMGIVVLVVLLLIVIPFLFTGSKKKPVGTPVETPYRASLQQPNQQTWTVQLASFSQQEHVDVLVKKLQGQKFDVYVDPVQTPYRGSVRIIYRVCVGKDLARQQAQKLVTKLQQTFGLKGMIIRGV